MEEAPEGVVDVGCGHGHGELTTPPRGFFDDRRKASAWSWRAYYDVTSIRYYPVAHGGEQNDDNNTMEQAAADGASIAGEYQEPDVE